MGSMILNGASTTSRSNLSNTVPCSIYQNDDLSSDEPSTKSPNIALISLILLIGTCVVALLLKKLRRSMFFGAYVRRTLSDVGILISIVFMVFVDSLIEKETGLKTQVFNYFMIKLGSKNRLAKKSYPTDWIIR
jgi:hypothetical protein